MYKMPREVCKGGKKHPALGCGLCKRIFKTDYQLDLHKYHIHRDHNIKKWTLKCTLCSFKSPFSTSCYKHGKVHHKLNITFQKMFQNTLKGKISFHYSSNVLAKMLRIQELRNKLEQRGIGRKLSTGDSNFAIKSEFFPCDECSFEANNLGGLKRHKLAAHPLVNNQSSSFMPKTRKQLSDHIKMKTHNLECVVCPYKTTKRRFLGNHVRIHPDGPYVTCAKCKVTHLDDYSLALHLYKNHRDFSELAKWQLRCKVCLTYKTRLKRCACQHSRAHCKNNLKQVKWGMYYQGKYYDSMLFRLESGKIVEDDIVASGEVPIHCPKCGYVGNNWDSFKKHYSRKHENVNQKKQGKQVLNNSPSVEHEDLNDTIDPNNCEMYTLQIRKEKNRETDELLRILNGSSSDEEEALEDNVDNKEVIVIKVVPDATAPDNIKNVATPKNIQAKSSKKPRQQPFEFECELCKTKFTNDRHLLEVHAYYHLKQTNQPDFELLFKRLAKHATWHYLVIKPSSILPTKPVPRPTWKFHQLKPKCTICGVLLRSPNNLRHHAYVHAKSEDNLNLKVRYHLYFNKEHVDTILALPKQRIKKKPILSEPCSDDDNLPFKCDECNFKSKQEEALKEHKKLHWNEEKEKAYREGKWFSCTLCSFHCFYYETFEKHQIEHQKITEKWSMISKA